MKKAYILVSMIIAFIALADVATFRDGNSRKTDNAIFDGTNFLIDEQKVPREEVYSLTFDNETKIEQETGEANPVSINSDLIADPQYLIQTANRLEKEFPDAGGVHIIDHGTYEYREDGSHLYRYHFAGRILKSSHLGWGQRPLGFEEGRSRVKLLYEKTITEDGQVFWWDTTEYTITDPSTEAGVFFSYGKVFSATFPQVTVGSIVEYVFESETYNPFDKNFFSPGFYFQDDIPIAESRCTVILPPNKELNFKNYNWPEDNNSPKITKSDSEIVYEWLIEDVPPVFEEPSMPSWGDIIPRFDASLFKDWDYIYDWLGGLQEARMVATPEIKAKVAEIVEDAISQEDSINSIYTWVQREIHYISIKASISSGQTGHPAELTFQQKYGDCTDKSILFATMLREIDVEAYPIIIMTNGEDEITRDIPDLSGNHAITLAIINGEKVFLDATSTTHNYPYFRSDDAGVTYVCALCRHWSYTSTPAPEENANHIDIKAKLDENGTMTAEYIASFTGDWEAGYRGFWENQQAERRGQILQDWMSYLIPGSIIEEWSLPGAEDLRTPFQEVLQLVTPSYPISAGDLWILKVPGIENEYTFEEISLAERNFSIEYTAPKQISHRIEFSLPEGYTVEYVPDEIDITTPYASYKGRFIIEDSKVVFEDTYRLEKRIIPAEDYVQYRDFCKKLAQYAKEQVFFKRNI
ncbi:DUF3857 and transglutaminase domain-containing protein [bacterium]|nr:DUF3857 and transglutaminase domain-containing protein [bacterium]